MTDRPVHASHSQISTYVRCGKQYFLERLAGVVTKPAAYMVAGIAIHQAIESMNRAAFEAWSEDGTDCK